MKKALYVTLAILIITVLVLTGCSPKTDTSAVEQGSSPIILKGVTVFDPERPQTAGAKMFADKLDEITNGQVKLEILGGPEVIKMFDQPEALKDGSIDYLFTFSASYKSMVPETIVMSTSIHTPSKERESGGYYDLLSEAHARPEMNGHYLGRAIIQGFNLYTNRKIETTGDFAGLKVGVTALWEPLTKAIGAVPVLIEEPDIYTALDRGVIDAYIGPTALPVDFGIYEITDYCIFPSFYQSNNVTHQINLDTWNSIPKDLQEKIDQAAAEVEPEIVSYFEELNAKDFELMKDKLEFIELPEDDAAEYIRLANSVLWEEVKPLVSDETFKQLKQVLE